MDTKKVNLKPKQSNISQVNAKRKASKSESIRENPIQIPKERSDSTKNVDEHCKEMSVSPDGLMKKSPIQIKKTRSDACKELTVQTMKAKNPIQLRKVKSEANKALNDDVNEKHSLLRKAKSESNRSASESSDGNEKHSVLRKATSESNQSASESSDGNVQNSLQLVRVNSEASKVFDENEEISNSIGGKSKVFDESIKNLEMVFEDIKKIPIEIKRIKSDENCKKLDVCEEKVITSNFNNVVDEEIKVEIEKKSLVVIEEKKHQQSNEKSLVPISPIVKKKLLLAVNNDVKDRPSPSKTKTTPVSEEFQTIPRRHSKLQSLVDLIMWKDVSKSALVFGIGTFIIISSSFTQDIKISIISVLSYLGLFYLAATFLFRSLIVRGNTNMCNASQDYVVGEEEAVWLMKMIVPYVNEFLLNIKALFSGDPATTMKMAVLLFVLARCGSSITIWKMAKLGFFGVFIVPKVCSSYSMQITAHGIFWIERFRDAWESCSHKKAVAFGVFTLVWNLSSIFARFWGVFVLFVAFKYYQQKMVREGWTGGGVEAKDEEYSWQEQIERHRKDRRSVIMDTRKQKKAF